MPGCEYSTNVQESYNGLFRRRWRERRQEDLGQEDFEGLLVPGLLGFYFPVPNLPVCFNSLVSRRGLAAAGPALLDVLTSEDPSHHSFLSAVSLNLRASQSACDRTFFGLKSARLVSPVTERTIRGCAAAAQSKCLFALKIEHISGSIGHSNWSSHEERAMVPDKNFNIRHLRASSG